MAHQKFRCEVLTPDGSVYDGEVEMVSTRTTVGSMGILAGHEPVLAILEPTELRLYESETEIVRMAQAEGYLQISEGRALLLVEEAHKPDDLDVTSLRERLERATHEAEEAEEDSEKRRVAERDQRRLEQFIAVAEGN